MFFETIRIDQGKIYHLEYHQRRLNRTVRDFNLPKIDLKQHIKPPKSGLYKLKLIYFEGVVDMIYTPYTPKVIRKLGFARCKKNYQYKYLQRDYIDNLNSGDVDEVIIIQNGFVTDTTIANIAFFDGKKWITPATPLLGGTTRQRLIDNGLLHLADIKKDDVKNFQSIALMNAMIGFYELKDFILKE